MRKQLEELRDKLADEYCQWTFNSNDHADRESFKAGADAMIDKLLPVIELQRELLHKIDLSIRPFRFQKLPDETKWDIYIIASEASHKVDNLMGDEK